MSNLCLILPRKYSNYDQHTSNYSFVFKGLQFIRTGIKEHLSLPINHVINSGTSSLTQQRFHQQL